ncbi:MAG TPA: hypothetical protein VH370_06500 [Humisphaera sp.]|jgi:hypothetical protein|nr:hypothetical protein [Humisphaera sp.]
MSLSNTELARKQGDQLILRPTPLRARWEFSQLTSADGHTISAAFTASVRAIPDRTERRMLEEVLLAGRASLSVADVTAHFQAALRAAAARAVEQQPAQQLLSDESLKQRLVDAMKNAAVAVAFACGLEVLPPYQLDLQSPTFERQRLLQMQQELERKQAQGQVEHFARAADLLKQFEALRAASPQLPPGKLLAQISDADRSVALRTLLLSAAGGRAAAKLWAVAGPSLVEIDPNADSEGKLSPKTRLISLPTELGPLRSVSGAQIDGRQFLLIGARSGIIVFDPEKPASPRLFHDAAIQTQHGFNRVVYWPQRRQFAGTHAEAGIVCWDADIVEGPRSVMRTAELPLPAAAIPVAANSMAINTNASYAGSMQSGGASGPRNLTVADDAALLFNAGAELFAWDGQSARPVGGEFRSEIVAILPEDARLLCICEDGTIAALDRSTRQIVAREQRSGRIRAAGALPWLRTTRLLLAGDEGPVQCVGLDDPLVTHYASSYRGLRMVAGSQTLVAAASPDRQRVILWNSWEGRQPAAEIFITSIARHRITDLALC